MTSNLGRTCAAIVAVGLAGVVLVSAASASSSGRRCPASNGPAYTINGTTSRTYVLTASPSVSCATATAMLARLARHPAGATQRKLRSPAGWTCYGSDIYGTGKATSGLCVKGKLGITWAPRDIVSSGA